jgi:hypothetical protein
MQREVDIGTSVFVGLGGRETHVRILWGYLFKKLLYFRKAWRIILCGMALTPMPFLNMELGVGSGRTMEHTSNKASSVCAITVVQG